MPTALRGHARLGMAAKAVAAAPDLSFDVRRTIRSVSYATHSPKGVQSPANAGSCRPPAIRPLSRINGTTGTQRSPVVLAESDSSYCARDGPGLFAGTPA